MLQPSVFHMHYYFFPYSLCWLPLNTLGLALIAHDWISTPSSQPWTGRVMETCLIAVIINWEKNWGIPFLSVKTVSKTSCSFFFSAGGGGHRSAQISIFDSVIIIFMIILTLLGFFDLLTKWDETPSNVLIGTRRLFRTKTRDGSKRLIILPCANHGGNPRTRLITVQIIIKKHFSEKLRPWRCLLCCYQNNRPCINH